MTLSTGTTTRLGALAGVRDRADIAGARTDTGSGTIAVVTTNVSISDGQRHTMRVASDCPPPGMLVMMRQAVPAG